MGRHLWLSATTPNNARVRQMYHRAKERIETQFDVARNGEWIPVVAEPGTNMRDNFMNARTDIVATILGVISQHPWDVAFSAAEDADLQVIPAPILGGGIRTVNNVTGEGLNLGQAGGATGSAPFSLAMEPHMLFHGALRNLNGGDFGELGFADGPLRTAGTPDTLPDNGIYLRYDGSANGGTGAIYLVMRNGGNEETLEIPGTPVTELGWWALRFDDDGENGPGSRCEVLINGSLCCTADASTYTTGYPDLDTAMSWHVATRNTTDSDFAMDIQYVSVAADVVEP